MSKRQWPLQGKKIRLSFCNAAFITNHCCHFVAERNVFCWWLASWASLEQHSFLTVDTFPRDHCIDRWFCFSCWDHAFKFSESESQGRFVSSQVVLFVDFFFFWKSKATWVLVFIPLFMASSVSILPIFGGSGLGPTLCSIFLIAGPHDLDFSFSLWAWPQAGGISWQIHGTELQVSFAPT